MGEKRNLTIQLDVDIIRKARVLAAERSVSISRLVAELLERLVGDEERYRAAEREALSQLQEGFHLGGGAMPSRDELHDLKASWWRTPSHHMDLRASSGERS